MLNVIKRVFFIILLSFEWLAYDFSAAEIAPVSVSYTVSKKRIKSDQTFWIHLEWRIEKGWHLTALSDHPLSNPPKIHLKLPKGLRIKETYWSTPKSLENNKEDTPLWIYEDKAYTSFEMESLKDYDASHPTRIEVILHIPVCKNVCIMQNKNFFIDLPLKNISHYHALEEPMDIDSQKPTDTFWWYILIALLAGFYLNFMPCVLPVITIKLMDFYRLISINEQDAPNSSTDPFFKKRLIQQSVVAYVSGILTSMVALSLFLTILKQSGHKVGWGFQMQSPLFLISMTLILTLMALHSFNVFHFGSSIQKHTLQFSEKMSPTEASSQKMYHFGKNFLNGLLVCLISTPCSAPFMGSMITFSLTQPFFIQTIMFLCLGLGLALPFLLVILNPKLTLLRFIPKPGTWMAYHKTIMGFLLMGSIFWLLWLIACHSTTSLFWTLCILWVTCITLWAHAVLKLHVMKIVLWLVSLSSLIWFWFMVYDHTNEEFKRKKDLSCHKHVQSDLLSFSPYNEKAIQTAREKGLPVLINFTAKWCMTCQVNKENVLMTKLMNDLIKKHKIQIFEGDWTSHDDGITNALQHYHYHSIPLLVYYPPRSRKPRILDTSFTFGDVKKMVEDQFWVKK